ncbi:MAG: hypothetical protein Q8J96_12920 [Rhodocyclaceae bacterium]|nr:hypothetical protein [Rhodocyclaceae bacterium]
MKTNKKTTLALATTAVFAASAAMVPAAFAADSPFGMQKLDSGYQLAQADKKADGKCGEGKCGGDKKPAEKTKDGKCGEGKCGGDKKAADKKPAEKKKDGKCGEGKCGSMK